MSGVLDNPPASAGRSKTRLVLADQAVVSAANFLMGLLLARYLGPGGYGQFVLTYNVVAFMAGIQSALIIAPMMVLGAALPAARARDYFSAILLEQLLFCVAVAVVLIVALAVANGFAPEWGLGTLLWPLVFATAGFLCQEFVRRYLFVQNRAGSALFTDLMTYGLRCACLVALGLALRLSTRDALWLIGTTCVAGVLACAALPSTRRLWRLPTRASLRSVAEQHWNFGKWLLAEIMVYWCGSQLIFYVTGHMISASAVGAMSAGQNIVGLANVLFLALENLVPSRAAYMFAQRGEQGLKRYLWRVTLVCGGCTLVIVVIAAIWAEFWLALIYGSGYRGDGWIVAWWGVFHLLGFLQRPVSVGLRVLGHTKGIFLGSAGSAAVAVTVSYPLIRLAGVQGAMLALCMVQAAGLFVMGRSLQRSLRSRGALRE